MPEPKRVAFVSLGCAKNLVDSEKMLGLLAEAGCAITADEADAEVIVVNTCGFLAASRDEAVGIINDVVQMKQTGPLKRVVVAGCLAQRDGDSLLDQAPGIDALVGVNNRADVVQAVLGNGEQSRRRANARPRVDRFLGEYYSRADDDTVRLRITPRHYAYLRISEGCDQKCTFCTIPAIRGPMHCKPPDAVIAEARELVSDQAVEINLIGQDTTSYGQDIGYGPGLAGLLRQLDQEVDGLAWLRLMYVYPSVMNDDIIDAVAQCDKVVKYIDMPLQHINDRVLKSMHRRVTRRQTETLLSTLRRRIEGLTLRTTLIAGFPGETDDEFAELLDFVRDFKFDALGVFAYSQEPDTPAGRMKDQVPDDVKAQRVEALMTAQQQVAFEKADAAMGKEFEVLVEGPAMEGLIPTRHAGQAPEVDSLTWLEAPPAKLTPLEVPLATPGRFVAVRCTGRKEYDLLAVPTSIHLPVLG
ncbi:MAG: 30S ribosomal protein S12 methylthiotransferase RimO [Phycisphaerae bacterium]